jgi:hypothetical protein
MTNRNRDLLLLTKINSVSSEAFEKHVEALHNVLLRVEGTDAFCTAHEMATRTHITQKKRKIIQAIARAELKPFYFLIAKN